MSFPTIMPTGVKRTLEQDNIIVCETDAKGKPTYVNRRFLESSGYAERKLHGYAAAPNSSSAIDELHKSADYLTRRSDLHTLSIQQIVSKQNRRDGRHVSRKEEAK